MRFNISAFTNKGTSAVENEDSILVNGQLLNDGKLDIINCEECFCFVADGVGGNLGGAFASYFVLNELRSHFINSSSILDTVLLNANTNLIELTKNNHGIFGAATTLSGVIFSNSYNQIVHCGDSEVWLYRNELFFKVTHDQVLNAEQDNSPLVNFFGGMDDNFELDKNISVNEFESGDIYLICTDGLFKSLKHKQVKTILSADEKMSKKLERIFTKCMSQGAEDNVSVILISEAEKLNP